MVRILPATALLAFAAASLGGQLRPTFEVASVKASAGPRVAVSMKVDGARAEFTGNSLSSLILRAYRLKYFQLSAPEWTNTAQFDVVGKLPPGAPLDAIPEMLQSLLEDRFKLTFRRDTKALAVYALVVGSGGPKLTSRTADGSHPNGTIPMTLDTFTDALAAGVDRPVVDQTGLAGEFMLSVVPIKRAVMESLARSRTAESGGQPGSASDPGGADIFGLVQELGLKLEPRKLAAAMLVVDHIEKSPTEN